MIAGPSEIGAAADALAPGAGALLTFGLGAVVATLEADRLGDDAPTAVIAKITTREIANTVLRITEKQLRGAVDTR